MRKKLVTVLVIIALILALGISGAVGFLWYRDNHIFVEDAVYPINAESLDLREEDISFEHYETVRTQLPRCEILWMVPFQGGKLSSDTQEMTLRDLSREDMELLPYFPNLRKIKAEFENYAILEELKAVRPDLEVAYQVNLGGTFYAPDSQTLTLAAGEFDLEVLTQNLVYLPDVTAVTFPKTELTLEQVEALRAAYEDIQFHCTVEVLGQELDMETTELDLSAMTSQDVEVVSGKLAMLPNLTNVELATEEGISNLTKEDVKILQTAAPQAVFHYAFEFFGMKLSTADEEVIIKNTKIGDENEAELRMALDLLPNCKRFVLDNCHFSDEVLVKVREDYRDQTKVVWRVWFGKGSSLTDAEVIRAVYDLQDDNCHDLVYCEDVRYIDFGHNEWLDACDFVSGMVNLEYIILSGSPIKSLEPFRNCKKLKFLEVAFCEYLTDASPLADCENLEMLNISNTHIVDLSPLDNLPLTNLVARMWTTEGVKSRVSVEEQERFMAANPDCNSYFSDKLNPYGKGWRYDEDGITPLPTYGLLRRVFRYELDPAIPNHVGWYLKNEEQEPAK